MLGMNWWLNKQLIFLKEKKIKKRSCKNKDRSPFHKQQSCPHLLQTPCLFNWSYVSLYEVRFLPLVLILEKFQINFECIPLNRDFKMIKFLSVYIFLPLWNPRYSNRFLHSLAWIRPLWSALPPTGYLLQTDFFLSYVHFYIFWQELPLFTIPTYEKIRTRV